MNRHIKILILFTALIFGSIAYAKQCLSLKRTCAYYSPDNIIHIGVKVNFTNTKPHQVVYLDGGCEMNSYEFKPLNLVNTINRYPHASNITFQLTYCIGNHVINEETIKVTSDSAIICNISDKMTCNKIAD